MINEEVIEYLTRIKGVESWTIEMLLIFLLGRADVFAIDELRIQKGRIKVYKLNKADKKN
jgi:DNA-3-methyladenine glycosylase II